ncbi:hypothetical protein B0H13DRAFT_2676835 [Mycena leptocephala]|nr:hypothetical protein B0H13DRAFT_2676835 [Mycena leptocephala]
MSVAYGESGIELLDRHVATEALHDSGERFPEPACYPGTRVEIINELKQWSARSMGSGHPILWLHGTAGIGKSAVAQELAGSCHANGQLGASFFFKRGHSKRGTWHRLIPTVVYQLANAVPGFSGAVRQAVENDRLVFGRSLKSQFQSLLVQAFKRGSPPSFAPLIILDGLDECEGHEIQKHILTLFIEAILQGNIPVRLLIGSRPEYHLREVFAEERTNHICRFYELSAGYAARRDVERYLRDEFLRIKSEFNSRGIHLGDVWPAPGITEHLVWRSCGVFIYASTVIRFIEDEYRHPIDALSSVLNVDPSSTSPLDDLYTGILSSLEPTIIHISILHTICGTFSELNPEEIDCLLELRQGTSRLALRALASLLAIPAVRTFVSYHEPFQSRLIEMMPKLLWEVTPTATLIDGLRNPCLQEALFMGSVDPQENPWPKDNPLYPSDLVHLWDDHEFISNFVRRSIESSFLEARGLQPTYDLDAAYTQFMPQHLELSFILKARAFFPDPLYHLEDILGLTYTIYKPLLMFRDQQYLYTRQNWKQ